MTQHQEVDPLRRRRWRWALWSAAAAVYLLPVALKLGTGSPDWGGEDYVFAAVMIVLPVWIYDATTRNGASLSYRAGMATALLGTFFLLWIAASVGIIGNSSDRANLLYGAVVMGGLTGGFAARGAADGMARTMIAMTTLQALITVIAVLARWGHPASGPLELVGINGMFIGMWLLAAFLFARASRERTRQDFRSAEANHA